MKCLFIPLLLIVIMLQLRPECVKPLQNLIKNRKSNKDETVTCIFGDHIQVEKLDETKLLPLDLMCIVHNYYDDKMIIICSYENKYITFNIDDNNNKTAYHYFLIHNMLTVLQKNFSQTDDSIMIISSPMYHFNLSRLYYHYYVSSDDLTFKTHNSEKSTFAVVNNKYIITLRHTTYISVILNHEILQRRIIVMKQLIDIIKKI